MFCLQTLLMCFAHLASVVDFRMFAAKPTILQARFASLGLWFGNCAIGDWASPDFGDLILDFPSFCLQNQSIPHTGFLSQHRH